MSDAILQISEPAPIARRRGLVPRPGRRGLRSVAYLGPIVAALVVCVHGPLAFTVVLSLLDWNLISPHASWRGAANYANLFTQPEFAQAAINTLWYALAVLPFATLGLLAEGVADVLEFTGDGTVVHCAGESGRWSVLARADAALPKIGDRVCVRVAPARLRLFDVATGDRLALLPA